MLTFEENQWNFQYLKFLSYLNILPIQIHIDREKGTSQVRVELGSQGNRLKLLIWQIFYCSAILHWLYIFGRLVESVLDGQISFRWDHFIIHFILTVAYGSVYVCGYLFFLAHPTDVVIIFNYVFGQNPTVENDDAELDKDEKYQNQNQSQMQNKDADQESSPVSKSTPAPTGNQDAKEKKKDKKDSQAGKGRNSNSDKIRPIFNWPLLYSLQELLARTFFIMLVGTGVFVVIVLGVDPSRPQLLYTIIPDEFKNWSTFLILLGLEGFVCLVATSFLYIFIITQLQFLDNFEVKCQRIHSRLRCLIGAPGTVNRKPTSAEITNASGCENPNQNLSLNQSLRQILKEMKELELCVELSNRCFPFCIFSFKIFCLAVAIFGCFFTIRKFEEHQLLAAFSGYCGIIVSVVYSITYEKAFAVPKNMERLKNSFLVAARSKSTTTAAQSISLPFNDNQNVPVVLPWAELQREVKRIRNAGIKVGGFHHMERMSTLIFVDFVLRNVVNLLVLFPR